MTPEDIANWLCYLSGPPILKDEVCYALKKLRRKPGKAASPYDADTETLQALDEAGIDLLHSLISRIYEWNDPIWATEIHLCHTPKKLQALLQALDCSDYRTISLISHVLKLLLKIYLERICPKIKLEIPYIQFGFVSDQGTKNAIFLKPWVANRVSRLTPKRPNALPSRK